MQTVKHQTYNDEILEYGKITTKIDEKTKTKTGTSYQKIGSSFFELASKRDEDIVFADSHNYSLDLKVKVPKNKLKNDYIVRIDNESYSIYKLEDSDKNNDYLYLQFVSSKGGK